MSDNKYDTLRLLAFGDIFLGGELEPLWYAHEGFNPFKELEHLVKNSDLRVGSFESTFFRGPLRLNRGTHLFSPITSIDGLKNLDLDIVSLANNHIMDFGTDAMLKTRKLLEENKISTIGAGINKKQASTGKIISRNNIKMGSLAFTTSKYHVNAITASNLSTGCAPLNEVLVKTKIREMKDICDLIVVFLHWGFEFIHVPHVSQKRLARKLLDYGADIIIGSHPHVVQGFEEINNKFIFYSLGNLIFPEFEKLNGTKYSWSRENNISLVPLFEIKKENQGLKISLQINPVEFKFPNVNFLCGSDKNSFINSLSEWNKNIKSFPDESASYFKIKDDYKAVKRRRLKSLIIKSIKIVPKTFIRMFCPQYYIDYIKIRLSGNTSVR